MAESKKTLTIFSNSVGYTAFNNGVGPDCSYVDCLKNSTNEINGYWTNGLTILHIRRMIKQHLKGSMGSGRSYVILHVGACECFTHPPENLLRLGVDYLSQWGEDPWFTTYIVPKMVRASKIIAEKMTPEFLPFLTVEEFAYLYNQVLGICEGHSVIIMGISKPNDPNVQREDQVIDYDGMLKYLSNQYNTHFIDVWNLCKGEVVDGTHITKEGHLIINNEIRRIING